MVQVQFNVMIADVLDRMDQVNLALVDVRIELVAQFVGDLAGGDRAEHLAVLARFDSEHESQLRERRAEFGHGLELFGFAVHAALLERFDLPFICRGQRNRESLRLCRATRNFRPEAFDESRRRTNEQHRRIVGDVLGPVAEVRERAHD